MGDKIVILTGAGISAESGLGTFRDSGGLWTKHALEDVATPEGFARDPALVHSFYNARRVQAQQAEPNAAHRALAQLQKFWPGDVVIVTQNVDGLHEAGGSNDVLHMHGQLDQALCGSCGKRWCAPAEMSITDLCPGCGDAACRPDVVWFGEIPYHMEQIADHLAEARIFVSIGTSGQVYPAAGFAQEARFNGAHTVALNLEPFEGEAIFAERHYGPATETVPTWVSAMVSGMPGAQGGS